MAYVKKQGVFYDAKTGRLYDYDGNRGRRIFWNASMVEMLRRHFPTTTNEEMAAMLGVSVRTVIRKARQLGIYKDAGWLRAMSQTNQRIAHAALKRAGYPGTFRKGEHANPGGEYKPGRAIPDAEREKHAVAMRRRWQYPSFREMMRERFKAAWVRRKMNKSIDQKATGMNDGK